jgi:hypothetical protein
MTLKAGLGVFPGVDDEFSPTAAGGDVLAARAVTSFAAVQPREFVSFHQQARMGSGGKDARDFSMAFGASLVTGVSRSFDFQRNSHIARDTGTRDQQGSHSCQGYGSERHSAAIKKKNETQLRAGPLIPRGLKESAETGHHIGL